MSITTNNFTTIEPIYENYLTSLRTKEVVEIPSIYNKLPKVTHIDPDYEMNFDQILDKPFLVTTINWSTTTPNFSELWRLSFPSAIMSNPLAKVPFNSSCYYQAKMCCMLQVSGTPMHQGLILVAALPHGTPAINNPNQILSAPHVFLNATESTSVCLECPMYTPSSVYRTYDSSSDQKNYNMATSIFGTDVFDLVFFVMDSLSVSSGSSTSISISVHHIFKEAHFYVPKVGLMSWQPQCGFEKLYGFKSTAEISSKCACGKKKLSIENTENEFQSEGLLTNLWKTPTKILDDLATGLKVVTGDLIDYGRGMLKELTGFHNPNKPDVQERMMATFRNFPNNVDQPVFLEVMDNHAQFSRIYDDYYFRTEQDEMDLKFLTSKPVFVGKFKVLSTDVAGKNLFAYPMTPMVEAMAPGGVGNTTFYSPLRTIYEASRYWRGNLKMHIQAVCTNFHYCKIIVLKNYAMNNSPVSNQAAEVPAYNNIHNINTDTMEFSAGGQIQTIDLKYNSYLRQLECTKDYAYNAIAHGMAYGYLVQPLTYNSNVPTTITFNVYISGGDDLQFSGYALDPVSITAGGPPIYPGIPNFFNDDSGTYEILEDGSHTGRILKHSDVLLKELEVRKNRFFKDKPTEYTVQLWDEWEDIAYITGNSLETLRNLNSDTHNSKSQYYNINKGPYLRPGEKLKFKKLWKQNSAEKIKDNFKAETMELAEGTNALVSPNSQDAILNTKVPCEEDIKMSFRPNTSVRDYLRFMYPQATINSIPIAVKNVVAINLNSLVNAFTNADYFHAISSLYLGMSGGLKLKFKISGAACASAIFVPPSCHVINGAYNRIYPMSNAVPTDPNSLTNFLTGTTYNPSVKSYTAPQIEMQDYTRPFNPGGPSVSGKPGSTFVIEMAIPNMNAFNFVGNATKWYPGNLDLETDLGVVYINYEASSDGVNYAPVHIIPFVGINDETRLGFQVYAPQKTIATYTSTSPAIVCRNSLLHPTKVGTSYPNGIPINPMPLVGSSYYFNST